MTLTKADFINKYLWIICLALGAVGFGIIFFGSPHKSVIDSPWEIISKILTFFVIVLGVSLFPNKMKHKYLLVFLVFIAYTAYLGPKMSYVGSWVNDFSVEKPGSDQLTTMLAEYYTLLYLILYPFIMLSVGFAYRIGGGTTGNVIKLITNGVLLLFGGLLDLMWWIINPVEIPAILDHAHHTKLFLGHYPTYGEAVIFFLCHIPFIVGIFLLPLDKWIAKLTNDKDAAAEGREVKEKEAVA